ncbi:MAG: SDR family oxidoreductase [Caldilineaceae bacterium]
MNTLRRKIALITGASRGLGKQIALMLASHGATVALVARSREALADTVASIQEQGGQARSFPTDLGDLATIEPLHQDVLEQLGAPSILINAAAIFGPIAKLHESDPDYWLQTMTVNTLAPYRICRAFVPDMLALGWGRIVNVTSAASLDGPGGLNSAYAASKVALNTLTRHLAAELEGTGITANVIHPGDVKTEMWADIRDQVTKLGPEAEGYRNWVRKVDETGGDPPEKASQLILKLMGDEMAQITGQFLWIEDGMRKPIKSW